MDITYTVKLTTIRFTSPPYEIPTIEIAASKNDPAAKACLMSAAHLMASTLWTHNAAGRDIEIEPPHNGVARVTMDAGRDDAEQSKVLDLMRRTVPATGDKPAAKPSKVNRSTAQA